jgi:hypothetical protein
MALTMKVFQNRKLFTNFIFIKKANIRRGGWRVKDGGGYSYLPPVTGYRTAFCRR